MENHTEKSSEKLIPIFFFTSDNCSNRSVSKHKIGIMLCSSNGNITKRKHFIYENFNINLKDQTNV